MTTTMINSKQRSFTFRMALVVGAAFLLLTLVLGVLEQWPIVVTLALGTIFFSLLVLAGKQLNRALLEDSHLPLTFPEEEFKPFVFKHEEVPEVSERQRLAA